MYTMDSVMREIEKLPVSEDRDVLLNNLEYADFPHLISLSGYNELLRIAGFRNWHWKKMKVLYIWTESLSMTAVSEL